MSTPQGIAHSTPRIRVGRGSGLAALAALIAVIVAALTIALAGTNHTTGPSATHPHPVSAPLIQSPGVASSSAVGYRYLGSSLPRAAAGTTTVGYSTTATPHTCVYVRGENRCVVP